MINTTSPRAHRSSSVVTPQPTTPKSSSLVMPQMRISRSSSFTSSPRSSSPRLTSRISESSLLSLLESPRGKQRPIYKKYTNDEIDILVKKLLKSLDDSDDSDDFDEETEICMSDDFTFTYNKRCVVDILDNINLRDDISLLSEMKGYKIRLGSDAAIFFNILILNIYGKLSAFQNFNSLKKEILSYPKYIKNMIMGHVSEDKNKINNINFIIDCFVKLIMVPSISLIINSLHSIISYKDINSVIGENDDLYKIFKYDIINPKYLSCQTDIYNNDVYYKYPLLIPSEFNKHLTSKNILLDNNKQKFLLSFAYNTFLDKKLNIEFVDYIEKLLSSIDSSMSFMQFTTVLVNKNEF